MGDDYYGFEGRGTLTIGKDLLFYLLMVKSARRVRFPGGKCVFSRARKKEGRGWE